MRLYFRQVVLKNTDNKDTANYGCKADEDADDVPAIIKSQATAISLETREQPIRV